MATELTAVDYLTRTVDRNRYFYGKLMTVRDFLREQEYFNSKRWLINRLLFGSGIVCGLEVSAAAAEVKTVVEVQPGVAFDPRGREITVSEPGRVDLARTVTEDLKKSLPSGGTGTFDMLVCLEYHECPKEPVPSLGGSPCEESCESNRVGETYTVSLTLTPPGEKPPLSCERWLNRQTVARRSADYDVERVAPVWVRRGEVFEVALKVTARNDVMNVQLSETVAGGSVVEPRPHPPSQFPTPPVSLRKGEFFIYVYQVQADEGAAEVNLSGGAGVPSDPARVLVLDQTQAEAREAELHLGACPADSADACVPVARVNATFDTGVLKEVALVGGYNPTRFRYSLTRAAELLDCVRASLSAADDSPRPGHLFITFKDLEVDDLQPVGPAAKPGTRFTVPRGDHVHALLLYENSGLDFVENRLRVEGNVGGASINFLNKVSGQYPTEPEHLATKSYVDSTVAGLDWQESVRSRKTKEPPAEPAAGDRYLIPGTPPKRRIAETATTWKEHPGHIATYDGENWAYTRPDDGTAVFVEDESIAYLFVEGKWMPFLATPDAAAGEGLYATGAYLNVGPGPGIKVNTNDVEVVYETITPSPVGPRPSAGTLPTSSRGDHTHELPLMRNGGLDFNPPPGPEIPEAERAERAGLHINGLVEGANIDFLNPVSGQRPTLPRHLATKQYVDGVAAGLDWQNSVLDKDQTEPPSGPQAGDRYLVLDDGPIIIRPRDTGEPAMPFKDEPRTPIKEERAATEAGGPRPRDDFRETEPVSEEPIVFPRNPWQGRANNIATWDGTAWTFVRPNEGMAVFVEDENTAYLFVDDKWSPFMAMPTVAAGAGLFAEGARLSVGQGSGLRVNENDVEVVYHQFNSEPVGPASSPGSTPALARGDHTHELPLSLSGGLEFVLASKEAPIVEGDERVPEASLRLRVNGRVNGESIDFLHPVSGQDPVDPRHLATKQYVDGVTAGLTWQSTVLDKDETKPPEEVSKGDRYLLVRRPAAGSPWEGQQGSIATWSGRRWDFTPPVEGMAAFVADDNLAYLYADGQWVPFLAPPAAVGAGPGLFQSGTDLAVGQGEGVVVTPDAVSVSFGTDAPRPVGGASFAGSTRQAAQSDHTHRLPLAPSGGLEFVGVKTEGGLAPAEGETGGGAEQFLRVNGQVDGRSIDFLFPVSGQEPTDARHLATKQYVDSKGLGTSVGAGLVSDQNTISVVGGPGLVVNPDEVHVNFYDDETQPVGDKGSPGASNAVARGDHTHAMPDVWGTSVATGVVAFNMRQAGKLRHVTSLDIDPRLGAGAIAVVVGLESELAGEGVFVGDAEQFEEAMSEGGGFRRFPPVQLGAAIQPPGFRRGTSSGTTFQIWARATPRTEVLPDDFRVRWWAYKVGSDFGVIDYAPPPPSETFR